MSESETPYRHPTPPPADPPPPPGPVVKGFSLYSVVVLVAALGVAGYLARAALTLEPPPADPAATPLAH